MFVILEGVDGAGKSSLATQVAAEIKRVDPGSTVKLLHQGPLDGHPLDVYVHSVADYVPGSHTHIVADRWHYGEEIYGPLYRGQSALTVGQWRWTELWLASRGVTAFHITQPLEILQARLAARGEDFLQSHHVDHVRNEFHVVSARAITHHGTLTPSGSTVEIVSHIVKRAQYTEQTIGSRITDHPSYVGPALPHTLLVGEKRGGQPPHKTASAFMPVDDNCGEFLLASLSKEWWRGVGLVNAVEENSLAKLWDELLCPNVVSLGKIADKAVSTLNIPYTAAPHPQRIQRRFNNSMKHDYGVLLENTAPYQEDHLSWPN